MTKLNQASMTFSNTIILIGGGLAVVLAVVEPIDLGRLPQAAPSLSPYRAEPASRLSAPRFDRLSQVRG